jgi:predicted ATPase
MEKLAEEFTTLQPDYQKVLQIAQESHRIRITPLLELKGGHTGANLFLVSVNSSDSEKLQHLILKLNHKSTKTRLDELERHETAIKEASAGFSRDHIPEVAFPGLELDGAIVIFYKIAGESLHNYRPLSSYRQQTQIEKIFRATNDVLLVRWNAHPGFRQALPPQQVLSEWLGYRLHPGGNIESFLTDYCQIHPETEGLMIGPTVFPNPLTYARRNELWGKSRPIDVLTGFQHGDLNIGNILARFDETGKSLEGYYLIDFALFKPGMPLFYDLLYLQMSYLIRELSRVSFPGWVELVTRFSEQDIPDRNKIPVEMAGTAAVFRTARRAFQNWVIRHHPSLSDDMWGQYWLAAVAAGLNYCNKTAIPGIERLAGLIFAAAHLKRYHNQFNVAIPREAEPVNIDGWQDGAHTGEEFGKKVGARRNFHLPVQTSPIIGRMKETEEILDLVGRKDLRLITLTGPGGTGKTRLAIHLASLQSGSFEDGVYFIELSAIHEPDLLLSAIARTIGIREYNDYPLLEVIGKQIGNKELLLLLDNFEQLIPASPLVGHFLIRCPRVKMIITSREPLRITGEQIYPVSPFAIPDPVQKLSFDQIIRFDAVQLFQERAGSAFPGFKITEDNAQIVAGICSRLDGLPLAIELAAGRIRLFSLPELLSRLDNRLTLLRAGARDLPLRQQTLENTIDWSYRLLNRPEKQIFAVFSVFHHCSIEDFENVAREIEQVQEYQTDILDILASLADRNLIRRPDGNQTSNKLYMLETIREFASERLKEDPELQAEARRKHAEYYTSLTGQLWKRLRSSERESTLNEFGSNIENIQIAWQYLVQLKNPEPLRKMTDSLWSLYYAKGWFTAIAQITTDLIRVIDQSTSTPERFRQEIMLQTSLGRVMMALKGCTTEVETIYNNALASCQQYGEIPESFPVLRSLASFYAYIGLLEKTRSFGEKILSLGKKLNDKHIQTEGYLLTGFSTAFMGELNKGLEYLEKGIATFNPVAAESPRFKFGNNPVLICYTTSAICSWMLGYPERSHQFTRQALSISDHMGEPSGRIYVLFHSGLLYHYKREDATALKFAETALRLAEDHEFQIWKAVITCLHGAALTGTGQVENGVEKFDRGLKMYSELKTPPIFWPMLLLIRAGLLLMADRPSDAMEPIEEASAIMGQATGHPQIAELYRLKGEVLLMISPGETGLAEKLFKKSLQYAVSTKTVIYELRAAISLSRLWVRKNRFKESRRIILQACDKFYEDLDSIDLKEAKTMLSQLQ